MDTHQKYRMVVEPCSIGMYWATPHPGLAPSHQKLQDGEPHRGIVMVGDRPNSSTWLPSQVGDLKDVRVQLGLASAFSTVLGSQLPKLAVVLRQACLRGFANNTRRDTPASPQAAVC